MKKHRSYIPSADGSENKDDRDDDRCDTDDAKDGTDGKRDARQEDEGVDQTDDVQPEISDASRKEPKRRYRPREPKAAMSKRRQTDSVENQDTLAKKTKNKAAPAKKSGPM